MQCLAARSVRLYIEETKQQLHKLMTQHRRTTSSGPDPAEHLHLKEKGHFEDSNVHILDREDRRFERGIKETSYVKLEKTPLNSCTVSTRQVQ